MSFDDEIVCEISVLKSMYGFLCYQVNDIAIC